MKRFIYECDRCHTTIGINNTTIRFAERTRIDSAGSKDTVCDEIDLCPMCARIVLSEIAPGLPMVVATQAVDAIRKHRQRLMDTAAKGIL